MFGCYRRTEAADAGTYVAAVALILTHYPVAVVDAVTDPFAGLPARKTDNGYSGLPDVADVKQACEDEAARIVRLANYRALGKTQFPRLIYCAEKQPGAWANVLIHAGHPGYAALKARTELEGQDPREWKIDERGLHVSLTWLEQPGPQRPVFQQFSEAELRRMYPAREAESDQTVTGS